jgi:hypothetical protein
MADIGRYCKAYLLSNIRQFPEWENDKASAMADDAIIYLQEDYSVTEDVFMDEKILFDGGGESWKEFCVNELQFSVPDYVDKATGVTVDGESESGAAVVN